MCPNYLRVHMFLRFGLSKMSGLEEILYRPFFFFFGFPVTFGEFDNNQMSSQPPLYVETFEFTALLPYIHNQNDN